MLQPKRSLFSMFNSLMVAAAIFCSGLAANSAYAQEADGQVDIATELSDDTSANVDQAEPEEATADENDDTSQLSLMRRIEKKIDDVAGYCVGKMYAVMFYPVKLYPGMTEKQKVPLAVLWLVIGAIFFTLRMGFINLRGFKHAVMITAGRYDNPEDEGEVTHFQALMSALSATVGLGNIAGVAIAISVGGPGAMLWMIVAGFLGMSSKFVECTLGQKYRETRPDGRVMGGAMYYLSRGLKEMGMGGLGKVLGVLFAVLCIGGSFAGGNAFQVNQSMATVSEVVPALANHGWVYGLIMMVLVGIVIIGGIKRIAQTAEKIVPAMCGVYVLAALIIILKNVDQVPVAFAAIWNEAFTPAAGLGGMIGVLVQGFKRAAFSNEAGIGSAAIAHSAAKTDYPVREGMVALLGPFIDTIVICTMTALMVIVTNGHTDPAYETLRASNQGAALTSRIMASQIPYFEYVLAVAVVLFAYSTMISWSYYGERCWAYLFGDNASLYYRVIYLIFVFLGSVISATNVLDFGDLMILGMAFPNVLGVIFLTGKVKKDLNVYWKQYKSGEFEPTAKNTTAEKEGE